MGPSSRCSRRCKFCVRIRNGSAFSLLGSIRQTAGCGGRAGKKLCSAQAPSNSSPQSSSSTRSGYYGRLRLQNPRRDDQTLDFTGAFIDLGDARVAVVALDGILAAVAVAAVNLNGFVRDARGHLAGKQFGDGGVHRESRSRILLPRCLAYEQARGVDFSGHVGEHELNGLELRNRLAKGHALLRIVQRRFKSSLCYARGLRGDADTPAVQSRKCDFVALAFIPDAVCNRHFAIREDELAARRCADPQFLFFFANLETPRAFFHD